MDKVKHTNSTDDNPADELTHDDMDMLRQVLKRVQGSSPDSLFRQSEYTAEFDPEA